MRVHCEERVSSSAESQRQREVGEHMVEVTVTVSLACYNDVQSAPQELVRTTVTSSLCRPITELQGSGPGRSN